MLWVWLFSKTPEAEPEEQGRSKGEVHIFNIYIIDSKRFQGDRLKALGQVHYTNPCVRRMDGRTDGNPNSDLSHIPKLVLIPIDAISVEKMYTHGQGKTYMAL